MQARWPKQMLSLFTEGHISSGKAAHLLNISRVEFLALLRKRGIDYLNYTADELAEEFAAVQALEIKTSDGKTKYSAPQE